MMKAKVCFFVSLGLALWLNSPPLALLLGLGVGLSVGHPFLKQNHRWSKMLLQGSVIGLGFGMNLHKVLEAGQQGLWLTVFSIGSTLLLGFALGKGLSLNRKTAHLVASGTAICGGSAIAAIGPVLDADEQEMSVSLGTVFILNALALLILPVIGQAYHLSQHQFGLWAAIAIHDTSSVVGTAAKYGNEALEIATTIKLARALWIVPVAILSALCFKQKTAKIAVPYFILFFLLASVLHTYVPMIAPLSPLLFNLSKIGLVLTLFLIGAGISLPTLKQIGIKPFLLGVTLWVFISVGSFLAILWAVR